MSAQSEKQRELLNYAQWYLMGDNWKLAGKEAFISLLDEGTKMSWVQDGNSLMKTVIVKFDDDLFFFEEVIKRLDDRYQKFGGETIPVIASRARCLSTFERFNRDVDFSSDKEAEHYGIEKVALGVYQNLLNDHDELSLKWLEKMEKRAREVFNTDLVLTLNTRMIKKSHPTSPGYLAKIIKDIYEIEQDVGTGRAKSKIPIPQAIELMETYMRPLDLDDCRIETATFEAATKENRGMKCYMPYLRKITLAKEIQENTTTTPELKPTRQRSI